MMGVVYVLIVVVCDVYYAILLILSYWLIIWYLFCLDIFIK
jgi:hypothetical protein